MKIESSNLNTLPVITWRWLKLNEYNLNSINLDNIPAYNKPYIDSKEIDEIYIKAMNKDLKANENIKYFINKKEKYGVSKEYVDLGEKYYNSGIFVHVPLSTILSKPIIIKYELDEKNPVVIDNNIIVTEENSTLTLIFDYTTIDDVDAFHNGVTKVYAKEGSTVNITKVQRMNDKSLNFDSIAVYTSYGAKVNYIQAELGAKKTITNYLNNLNEENSETNVNTIYLGDGDRDIDLSYLINHIGRRSLSNIEAKGALMDNSRKVFRGTIDFKKGSSHSKGREEEYAILLDKSVKSAAIPLLLCTEEDVDGQHAASAGKIDENKLFYLMSRGLDEKEAKKLIVEASFDSIINKIPSMDLKEIISKEIHRRIVNE